MVHGGLGPTEITPYEPVVIDPIYFSFSSSLGLFTRNISCGKNLVHKGLQGAQKFFSVVFDKHIIFWKKKSDKLWSIFAQNHLVAYVSSNYSTHEKRLRQFFAFSGKIETSFRRFFAIMYKMLRFFPVLSRGIKNYFSLEALQIRLKMLTLLIFIK